MMPSGAPRLVQVYNESGYGTSPQQLLMSPDGKVVFALSTVLLSFTRDPNTGNLTFAGEVGNDYRNVSDQFDGVGTVVWNGPNEIVYCGSTGNYTSHNIYQIVLNTSGTYVSSTNFPIQWYLPHNEPVPNFIVPNSTLTPSSIAATPDGSTVYVKAGNNYYFTINPATQGPQPNWVYSNNDQYQNNATYFAGAIEPGGYPTNLSDLAYYDGFLWATATNSGNSTPIGYDWFTGGPGERLPRLLSHQHAWQGDQFRAGRPAPPVRQRCEWQSLRLPSRGAGERFDHRPGVLQLLVQLEFHPARPRRSARSPRITLAATPSPTRPSPRMPSTSRSAAAAGLACWSWGGTPTEP